MLLPKDSLRTPQSPILPKYFIDLPLKTMADVAPITPKKGEYMGLSSALVILDLCVLSVKMGRVMIRVGCEKEGCHMSAAARNHPWTSVTRLGTGVGGVLAAREGATTKDSRKLT